MVDDEQLKKTWLDLYSAGGITIESVCRKMVISKRRVFKWKKEDPAFFKTCEETFLRNKQKWDVGIGQKFGRDLPKEVVEQRRLEIIAKRVRRNKRKRGKTQAKWLNEYGRLGFNITEVSKACGITAKRFRRWLKLDEDFALAYEEAREAKKDYIESKLMENIAKGDSESVIFACKTQLKDRGYVETKQMEHSGNFGVMLSPGTAPNTGEWEKIAKAQQVELGEKTSKGE